MGTAEMPQQQLATFQPGQEGMETVRSASWMADLSRSVCATISAQ